MRADLAHCCCIPDGSMTLQPCCYLCLPGRLYTKGDLEQSPIADNRPDASNAPLYILIHKHTCSTAPAETARGQVPKLPPCLPKSKFATNDGGGFFYGYSWKPRERIWRVTIKQKVS